VGTEVRGGIDYSAFEWNQKVAAVFGNEASGLGAPLVGSLDATVSIPMVGRAESLNVSVSAAVLCFEALRQRQNTATVTTAPTMPGMDSASLPTGHPGRPGSGRD
jgi:tRNA G18 (ribose-2'-O)-methylase SpoU